MCMMAYNGTKSHPPLRRISASLPIEEPKFSYGFADEESADDQGASMSHSEDLPAGLLLPTSFVSVPTKEDGHVALRQQLLQGTMSSEPSNSSSKKWHHKAIRRNISKAKELVLFVGKLPENLPSDRYFNYATQCTKVEKSSVGPIFPTLGCFFITFTSGKAASDALKLFSVSRFQGNQAELLLLPYIHVPTNASAADYDPLLVFINCKSGGGQGSVLYDLMKESLNPYQIFLIENGGAMPGLYAFRKLPRFRILVCGGDGTVGWVMSHIEVARRHLACSNPPIAILPVGTGNDLARVLGYGSGWGGENVNGVLAQVQDTQTVMMDRWNLLFDSHPVETDSQNPTGETSRLLMPDHVSFQVGNDNIGVLDSRVETAVVRGSAPAVNVVMSLGGHANGTTSQALSSMLSTASLVPGVIPAMTSTQELSASPGSDSSSSSASAAAPVRNATGRVVPCLPAGYDKNRNGAGSHLGGTRADGSDAEDLINFADDATLQNGGGASPAIKRTNRGSGQSRNRLVHVLSDESFGSGTALDGDLADDQNWQENLNRLRLTGSLDTKSPSHSDVTDTSPTDDHSEDTGTEPSTPTLRVIAPDDDRTVEHTVISGSQLSRHHSVKNDSAKDLLSGALRPNTQSPSMQKKYSLPAIPSYTPVVVDKKPEAATGLKIVTMNSYFGIGIDAEMSLAFHLAREENPEKCTSRFRNKAIYFKAGLKKMTGRSVNLNNVIDLMVDHVHVPLPSIKGLIFLNIASWGSGSNAWGSGASRRFATPSMGDGMLEILGVGGMAHMSQMYSGLRTGIRLAQGVNIKMTLKAEVAVQADGEPWMQPPGKIIITLASTQAAMLKRVKKKSK